MRSYHRADLLQVLLEHVPPHYGTHFSKRLDSYVDDPDQDVVILRFADGTSASCDILIGADGIKSAVRRKMYTEMAEETQTEGNSDEQAQNLLSCITPVWSGERVYRHIITRDDLVKSYPDHPSLSGPVQVREMVF